MKLSFALRAPILVIGALIALACMSCAGSRSALDEEPPLRDLSSIERDVRSVPTTLSTTPRWLRIGYGHDLSFASWIVVDDADKAVYVDSDGDGAFSAREKFEALATKEPSPVFRGASTWTASVESFGTIGLTLEVEFNPEDPGSKIYLSTRYDTIPRQHGLLAVGSGSVDAPIIWLEGPAELALYGTPFVPHGPLDDKPRVVVRPGTFGIGGSVPKETFVAYRYEDTKCGKMKLTGFVEFDLGTKTQRAKVKFDEFC